MKKSLTIQMQNQEFKEHYEIYQTIEKRTTTPYKSISHKDMLARLGISENELKENDIKKDTHETY